MEIYKIILLVLLIVILIILTISYIVYRIAFFYKVKKSSADTYIESSSYSVYLDKMTNLINQLKEKEYEEVMIKSTDKKFLYARYYHVKDGAPLDIAFHGYRGSAYRDMCGSSNESFLNSHNLLLVDERAHGKSKGKVITFGIKERLDCLSWINYAISRFGENLEIILCGVSMGASVVLHTSSLNLPENVKGIIADCPYSTPKKIIKKVINDYKLPKLSFIFVYLGALIFGHFNINKIKIDELAKSRTPLLLIHGKGDTFVPYSMSEELYQKYGCLDKELLLFNEANHGLSYFYDNERYVNKVNEFMNKVLGPF